MDELEVVEETAPEPEAQLFSQRVEEPAPVEATPEPEPQQVETPTEPEAPPVEPDWLSAPPEPEPQYQQPQQQYYEPPPQQAPPQPSPYQQQARGGQQSELDRFLDMGPQAYVEQALQAIIPQQTGPLQQQTQAALSQVREIQASLANASLAKADEAIRRSYETFNKDASFRSNKALQGSIQGTLQNMRAQAINEARNGNFDSLNRLAGLQEHHVRATLAAAREMHGIGSPGTGPLQVEGATVESSKPATADQLPELNADQREAIKRFGSGYETRYRKALAETAKYDDFEG